MDNHKDLLYAVAVQSLSCVRLFATPWTAAYQASLSFTVSQILLKLMSIESVMLSNHLIFYCPLLLLPSIFSRIQMSQLFASGGQTIGATVWASALPVNIQGWSCCPRDSQESSPAPQFESINSTALSILYWPNLTLIHDYWKTRSFDYMHLCHPSDISAF